MFMSRTFKNRKFKLTSYAKNQPVQLFLTFFTTITRWSYSTANYYVLIGQNLTGEFIHKIYAASGTVCLIAETDRVLCHLVMFFPLGVQNEIQLLSRFFCYLWLVCLLGFWLRNTPLIKVIGNPISGGIVFLFTLLDVLKSLKRSQPNLMASRSCISTSKLE